MSRERPWHVQRSGVPTATGQQHWDRAYQLLLQWATTPSVSAETLRPNLPEASHACSPVRSRLDQPSSRAPNH